MDKHSPLQELSGKRVVVMGLGRFGGGVGVTRHLVSQGADVTITDCLAEDHLSASLAALAALPVEYRLGGHNVSDFTTADLVVVNPAVDRSNNRFLRAAAAAQVELTSEIQLLIAALAKTQPVIGVTGTAGKSTVTAMIGHILADRLGDVRVHVGGNIGGSLLARLEQIKPNDWVVLELSSFMLEAMCDDGWSPRVAVVTNLSSNHLDRHLTMRAYAAAKQVLLNAQSAEDRAVLGPGLGGVFTVSAGGVTRIESPPDPCWPLVVPGRHNQINAALAVQAAVYAGIEQQAAIDAVGSFPGLPHRLQLIADQDGVRYFNDSKATTPAAAILAIEALTNHAAMPAVSSNHEGTNQTLSVTTPSQSRLTAAPLGQPDVKRERTPTSDESGGGGLHVILGGYDKTSDLCGLAAIAARRCRGVYTIGATGDAIAEAAETVSRSGKPAAVVVRCGVLEKAVVEIQNALEPGDAVLLSPGCASWDQFENYEQRGEAFIRMTHRQKVAPSTSPTSST